MTGSDTQSHSEKSVVLRRKPEIKRPSHGFLGPPRHSDEPTRFKSQLLLVTHNEAPNEGAGSTDDGPGSSSDARPSVLRTGCPSACTQRWFSPLRVGVHRNSRRLSNRRKLTWRREMKAAPSNFYGRAPVVVQHATIKCANEHG